MIPIPSGHCTGGIFIYKKSSVSSDTEDNLFISIIQQNLPYIFCMLQQGLLLL